MEVRAFMPRYGCINERRNQLHEVIRLSGLNLSIDDADHPLIIKVATLLPTRMQVYFIDNDDYFQPSGLKELEVNTHPQDNDERIMFFAHGVIETVKKLRWRPAIIQCAGWAAAMVPVYLRDKYGDDPTFSDSKIVYNLHSEKFDGTLDPRMVEKLVMGGFSKKNLKALGDDAPDYLALNKLAIDHADILIQADNDVDPQILEYARATSKPFLAPAPGADITPEQCSAFYRKIIEEPEN